MAYRNFIQETNIAAVKHATADKEKLKAAYEDCSQRFWSYCGIAHYMAQQEYLKVFDYYDDRNKVRGSLKKMFKDCNEDFNRYDKFVEKNMDKQARNLLIDFHNNVYGGLQKQILDLTLTFKFYYEREGLQDIDIKAQITTTSSIISMAADLWHEYFDAYKKELLIDFSKDYEWARLDRTQHVFSQFAEDTCLIRKKNLEPTRNYASVQAFNAICDKMVDDDFMDEVGLKALKFNHYDKEIKEIETSQLGLDRLKQKYKTNSL